VRATRRPLLLPRHQWRTKYLLAARRFPGLTIQASAKDTATIITDRSRAAVTRIATAVVPAVPRPFPKGDCRQRSNR
jgi:hypothetical protein